MAKLLQAGLWPAQARAVVEQHNAEFHGGLPTARVSVDTNCDITKLPKYQVWCPICFGTFVPIIQIGANEYEVESKSHPGTYYTVHVLRNGLGYRCDCTGYRWRHWCDHCQQVKDYIAENGAATASATLDELLM